MSKEIPCLFDTGSELSLMSKRLAVQIGAKLVQRHPVRIKQAMTTVDVETWSTTVNLEFDNQCSDVKFLVGNDFSHPVLLGVPDMERMNIDIFLRDRRISCGRTTAVGKAFRVATVRLKKTVNLDGLQMQVVPVYLSRKVGKECYVVDPIRGQADLVASCVVLVEKGDLLLPITNWKDGPRTLYAGQKIAIAYSIEMDRSVAEKVELKPPEKAEKKMTKPEISEELRQRIEEKIDHDCDNESMRVKLKTLLLEGEDRLWELFQEPIFGQAKIKPVNIRLKPGVVPVNIRPHRMS